MNPYSSTKEQERKTITPDQTKRAQENRQRALERQRATPTQKAKTVTPSSPAAGLKSTEGNISLTPQQRQRMEENRKRALERKAANEAAKKRKKYRIPCYRCGATDLNSTLCIDWKHTGDIQRERNPFNQGFWDRDVFRYKCCGRLSPQPCHVGRHDFPSIHLRSPSTKQLVLCACHKPASLMRTKKDGPDVGRFFFRCNSGGRRAECSFFAWADQAFGLPPQRPLISPEDGVKEWIYIHANPFQEKNIFSMSVINPSFARKRVIAAVIIHEMITKVSGPMVQSQCPLDMILHKVIQAFETKTVVKNLYPLTLPQIFRRFGCCDENPEELQAPSPLEVKEILTNLVSEENQILRSTVILETLSNKSDSSSPGVTFVDLSGLEDYIAVSS